MKKITVHSSSAHSKDAVFVDEDGKKIENVVEAVIRMAPNELTTVDLTIRVDGTNVVTHLDAVWLTCPMCNTQVLHTECDRPRTLSGP